MRALIAIFVFLLSTGVAADEEIVVGLSQNRVSITANFDGSEILIFGAVKRDEPAPTDGPLEVVIAVAGPSEPVVVRRKARRYGVWVNIDSVEVDAAPSFYAVASTGSLFNVLSHVEDLRHKVSVERMIRSIGAPTNIIDSQSFSEAVVRVRGREGLYFERPYSVLLSESTLFRTNIGLPANLVEGDYRARIFLTRNKKVVDFYETDISVRKVGLERWIFNLAHSRPLIYGFLSLFIAISAGWIASTVFRLLRI